MSYKELNILQTETETKIISVLRVYQLVLWSTFGLVGITTFLMAMISSMVPKGEVHTLTYSVNYCGNGSVEADLGEECEPGNITPFSCTILGYNAGVVSGCDSSCRWMTDSCAHEIDDNTEAAILPQAERL